MKKGWKVILIIVFILILLGVVCAGVGVMTGADFDRIYSVLDERYHIDMYYQYAIEVFRALTAAPPAA